MQESYRDALGRVFARIGGDFPSLTVVTADVSKSTRSIQFKNRYPERFFSVGIAEADAVGISAGLATWGDPVLFTAYSVFATEKPFEQIRNMLCYPNLNVKIVATHGGINTGEDGVTHQAIEDIAIMRALPNMHVLVAADPGEVWPAVKAAVEMDGPVFVRLGRAVTQVLHDENNTIFIPGKAELLRDGKDVCLMAVGMMVNESIKPRSFWSQRNFRQRAEPAVCEPIDVEAITSQAKKQARWWFQRITTLWRRRRGGGGRFCPFTVPSPWNQVALEDTFAESGKSDLLLKKYGLTAEHIAQKAEKAMERRDSHAG
mgnify:CR=1 FL=1